MRSSEFHVEISGVRYRLAEDAEGEHYVHAREKTRPPNAQIVQGESGNKFNSRPDMLLWSWTDWSEGEGQLKFDQSQPGRANILQGVNWFGRPGNLFLGYMENEVDYNFPGTPNTKHFAMVVVDDTLYGVEVGSGADNIYKYQSLTLDYWHNIASGTWATTDGARDVYSVCADNDNIYMVKAATDSVYKWDGSTVTHLNDQTGGNVTCKLISAGDYLYKYDADGKIYELSKVTANLATPEVPILDFSSEGTSGRFTGYRLIAGDNRIYAGAQISSETVIYEIVPSSASGTGFGRELARIPGLLLETMWWHGGYLYWSGTDNEPDGTVGRNRSIYYYQPGGSWGTLGELRSHQRTQPIASTTATSGLAASIHSSALLGHATYDGLTAAQACFSLFEVDAVSGGYGCTGVAPSGLVGTEASVEQVIHFGDKYFASYSIGGTSGQTSWTVSKYTAAGLAISPTNDFGIASWKILHSIEIQTEPLPADTSVTVSYKLDDGSWTALSAHDTDGSGGTKWTISTGGSTKTFRYMALKVELAGTSTATPVVKGIDVRASVDEYVNVWQLLLDCTDESSPRGYSGATLVDHVTALSDTTMFVFYDGYEQREFSVDLSYNVVIDDMAVILTKPGEGYVQVTLREVF